MTTLTAYAPSYLPWKGLFQRIAQADILVLTDTDRYSPKDFHNRNRIVTRNGPVWLTVPVQGGRDQRLCDVAIDGDRWRGKHWETIRHAYGKAPFFKKNEWWIRPFFNGQKPYRLLADLNAALIANLGCGLLGKQWRGFRRVSHPQINVDGTGSEFILNMCKHFNADRYLCGEAGRNYLDLDAFNKADIEVIIQPYEGEPVSALHHLFTEGAL